MTSRTVAEMKAAHRVLAEFTFEPRELEHGYANQWLRVDLGQNQIEIRPITPEMKELWTGGKGFDLWLTFQEVDGETRWDSANNPICMSSGPLGGTTSYPGSGKTLVTAISPATNHMIDCNVGGYFGPYLKFAGFDALMIIGKASEEVIVNIDAITRRVTIETAPLEAIDSHVLAEELTEMYSNSMLDRRNVAVVSAGRAAQHSFMGVLNFSFYDWRRRVSRLKQAGRGGIGTVLRDKKVKALVLKNRDITPAWRVAESKVAPDVLASVCEDCETDLAAVRRAVEKYEDKALHLLDILQEVQDGQGFISRSAMLELSEHTGVSMGALYELVTFYASLTLQPTDEALPRVREEMASFVKEQMFRPGGAGVYDPDNAPSYLAPGAWTLLQPLFAANDPKSVTPDQVDVTLGVKTLHPTVDDVPTTVAGLLELVEGRLARSCGKCTPCREGLFGMADTLRKLDGENAAAGLDFVEEIAETLQATAQCMFGRQAARPVLDSLATYREALVKEVN